MHIQTCMIILACVSIVGGCLSAPKPPSMQVQALPPLATDHVESTAPQLTIEECVLTSENLTLRYRMANTSCHDLWICTTLDSFGDKDGFSSRDVRICDGVLWIRYRANLIQNCLVDGMVFARYRRLLPGQTYSQTVVLPRPIIPFSLVYSAGAEFAEVTLGRIVVEMGYFNEDLPSLIERESLRRTRNGWQALRYSEALYRNDPSLSLVPYLESESWDGLSLERSISVTITDVAVPARVGAWVELPTGEVVGQRDWRPPARSEER
jgi:hypothetical protein